MGSITLNTRYRPVRIGFCIRRNDLDAAISAIDLAHTIWGGRFCPLIPCDDPVYADGLIKDFHIDTLYPVATDEVIETTISRHRPLAWPLVDKGFYTEGHTGKSPQFLSVTHPLRLLKQRRHNSPQQATVVRLAWEEDDPLSPWLCALVGRYLDNDTSRRFNQEFESLWPKRLPLGKDQPLPSDLLHQVTPNSITALDIHLPGRLEKAVYVACGDRFYDIVTFWNLRAAGEKAGFYDHQSDARLDQVLSRFRSFKTEKRLSDDSAPLRVFAKNAAALEGGRFSGSQFTGTEFLNIRSGIPLFAKKSRSVLASTEADPSPTIDFALPQMPSFDDAEFYRQYLVLEITTFSNVITHTDHVFPPPPVPALNEFYAREIWYIRDAVRVIPQGIAVFVRATEENVQLRAVETFAAIQQLFALAGIRAHRSKPGLIARQLIEQMGHLQACRVFKIPGVRALIDKYGPTQSFVRSEAVQLIRDEHFAEHESLYIEKRVKKNLTAEDVFAFLLNKEVFRAGLELECPNCQLQFWKHVDECLSKLPCDYCGKVFNITPQLHHRGDWRFRRSGLFGASNNQEGSVPVVLTLQQIQTSIHEYRLTYTTAVKFDGDGIDCESDFVVVNSRYDGTVEVVLSECKTRDEISQKDVDNLSGVARKLTACGLKVFLLFSKTGQFTPTEIARCKQENTPEVAGTIMLSARELEPYFMYERASKEFHVESHGVTFEDMVQATQAIYFRPRPRKSATEGQGQGQS